MNERGRKEKGGTGKEGPSDQSEVACDVSDLE